MNSVHEIETLARLQRQEVARQVAAVRRAQGATRSNAAPRAWRQHLATALRVAAARLAPATGERAADAEPVVT
jgi:hypothetical protein